MPQIILNDQETPLDDLCKDGEEPRGFLSE